MEGSTRLLADSCWLSKHIGRILPSALPEPKAALALQAPHTPGLTSLPMQCPYCSKGVRAHVSEASRFSSTREFLQRGKEKKSYPALWDSEQKVVEGSQTARASPAAPEQQCCCPFPADSISCGFHALLLPLQPPSASREEEGFLTLFC